MTLSYYLIGTQEKIKNDSPSFPSLELAAKWLREEKKIWFRIDYNHNSMPPTYSAMLFGYSLRPYINGYLCSTNGIHTKYEDALSECIDKVLEILKEK